MKTRRSITDFYRNAPPHRFIAFSFCRTYNCLKIPGAHQGEFMEQNHSDWLTQVPNKPLSRVVTDQIKDALLQGQLKPGDYLPSETELSEKLGVGKSSVREAVKMLEAIGVVEIIKGHGSRIRTRIDSDSLNPLVFSLILQNSGDHEKLLEFRLMAETAASRIAAKRITEKDLDSLRKLLTVMKAKMDAGEKTVDDDVRFHTIIYDSTQNPFISCLGLAIMSLFKSSMSISNELYPAVVYSNHVALLKALEDHSEEEILKAVSDSVNKWYQLTLEQQEDTSGKQ